MADYLSKQTKQSRSVIVQYALFRWENAMLLGGAIVLTWLVPKPFTWWPVWAWLAVALLGITAIFLSSLTNARSNASFLLQQFQGKFDLRPIKLPELRQNVEMALEYQRRIEFKVRREKASLLWDRPEDVANQLHDWIDNIYGLAVRLDAYRRDTLLSQEREHVPQELEALQQRRKKETNPAFQGEIDQVIDTKQKQLEAVQALDGRMKQAELQLAQSLAALATINSQIQLIEAQDVAGGKSERIQEDIREQVNRLGDLVTSINEVYDYKTPGIG